MRIHGELPLRNLYTRLNGQNVCKTHDRLHEELYLHNVCHGAFWDFARVYKSTNVSFDYKTLKKNKKQYIISFL